MKAESFQRLFICIAGLLCNRGLDLVWLTCISCLLLYDSYVVKEVIRGLNGLHIVVVLLDFICIS